MLTREALDVCAGQISQRAGPACCGVMATVINMSTILTVAPTGA
jgi:hypothetical protein